MKRLLWIVIFTLLSITSLSAQEVEHLKFKGVPIDGTLDEFVSKLEATGLTFWGKYDGVAILRGTFVGERNCMIIANSLENKDLAWMVAVCLPGRDTWSLLLKDYEGLKSMLEQKYGVATQVIEEFKDDYVARSSTSDFLKLSAVRDGECTYTTLFETELGNIELLLMHNELMGYCAVLRYYDLTNSQSALSSAIDDL
uniref:hypothetical protein n=1 Tax=Alistipes sp. TaxID=1872444 RepID=UPI00405726D2